MSAAVRLGDLCYMIKGTSHTLKTDPGPYPLVVTAAYRRTSSTYQLDGPAVCVPLVSSTGHGDAAIHRVHYQEGQFALANLLVALKPKDESKCNARFLYYFLTARKDDLLVPLMLGTANVSLKERDVASVSILLPPLEKQKRLVQRTDALSAMIEEARQLRLSADQQIQAFPRSHLDQVYETQMRTWGITQLGDICLSITDGAHLTPTFQEGGVKFIFVGNVSSGHLHFTGCKYVTPEYFAGLASTRKPELGDVLYTAVGATLGVPALVNCNEKFCFQRHVAIIRPDRKRILPAYLWYILQSGVIFRKAWSSITGTAQPTVPLKVIKLFPIPVPELDEQYRVVGRLEQLLTRLEEVKRHQSQTMKYLDAMLPAILNRAFKGDL